MRRTIELPTGEVGVLMIDIPLRPERGTITMRRWDDMIGARAQSDAKLVVENRVLVQMDLVPREVVLDGLDPLYQEEAEERRLLGCIYGGLRTDTDQRRKGYGTAFLYLVNQVLKEENQADLIFNFVLDERLQFFLDRGWKAVDPEVKVTIQQPKKTVPLPGQFTTVIYPLAEPFEMPTGTFECLGLPA